jgi:alpha-L-fucosidase
MEQSWFADARFGMFVHWGIYSQQGWEPSWPLTGGVPIFPRCQSLDVATYYDKVGEWAPGVDTPRDWARRAKACGMTYAVLTTKHHDGFALFDCEAAEFGVRSHLPGRDLVREFVDAVRAEGLRVGLYYSLSDWHHPDYPPFTDAQAPYGSSFPRSDTWDRYVADMKAQLDHLMTAYGTIDLIWFDGGWERHAHEWDSPGIVELLRSHNPDVVINDRLPEAGDYDTPEQGVPHSRPARWWETCMTMGDSWGPLEEDDQKKSAPYLLSVLAEVAAMGGNLLLNVSPFGDGSVPQWQIDNLDAIASWTQRHIDCVVGTDAGLEPWQFHGPTTRRGDTVFLFCPMRPQEMAILRGVRGLKVASVRAVGTDTPLTWNLRLSALDRIIGGPDVLCDVLIDTPSSALDDVMTVIEVTFAP